MKKKNKFNSILLIAAFLSITIISSACFNMPPNHSNSSSITIDSSTTITQQNTEEYITECFLGFHFGMTQYDVSQNLENRKKENKYYGEYTYYEYYGDGFSNLDCFKFKLSSGYIYVPKYFCYYHEGVAYWFEFYIKKDEFYSFVDAYKNSKNHYTFEYDQKNTNNYEMYRFSKNNLAIDCCRKNDLVRIAYINLPEYEKVLEEQETEENDDTYYSDF